MEGSEIGSIIADWISILAENDVDDRLEKVHDFIQRYDLDPSETAQHYMDKVCKELNRLLDEKEARKDWIDAKQTNTILGYADFITKHPYSDYREEADRLIQEMKSDVITDMKRFPSKYHRDDMYHYISTNALTNDDLVYESDLLTEHAYRHIIRYPSMMDEYVCPPIYSDKPENDIILGNFDVLFFGVCGSGGKTCLLASLMSLVGESTDFLFQEFNNNKECDNAYGTYLADYMHTNRCPPGTDTYCIQVVNTLIKCNDKYKGVSFLEFAGEQVHALAGNSIEEGLSDGIIPSLVKILNNNNKKIIFLTIDPTNLREFLINNQRDDDAVEWVSQSYALSSVISHFKNASKFMRNIIGFHTIISKSDLWLKGSLREDIDKSIERIGAKGLLLQIEQLCDKYKIASDTTPIPFSIGKFMPGNTYEFDDRDAKKLFQLIKKDIESYEENRNTLSRIKKYFNS